MKILLIDDSSEILEELILVMNILKHNCKSFANSHEAIAAYKKEDFDVVITDYKMPLMNGVEVAKAIRRHKFVPIVMMSGCDPVDINDSSLKNRNYTFLEKPFSLEELRKALSKIEKVLSDY